MKTKDVKTYKLINEEGKQIISKTPGTLGGNKRLKIYGTLDCPSAKRWIDKGYYVQDRVFFKDEETAVKAGYRPCAVCMPKEYKEWKQKNDTLKYYDEHAQVYFDQTKKGDMSENYNRFLMLLPKEAYILDFGCGSGRDSKYFIEHGYRVTAIDGSQGMCDLASKYIGQPVRCMRFDELEEKSTYDGIWACSSILHVTREELPSILKKMLRALKEDGVIYASFKLGDKELVQDNKYYNYITLSILEKLLKQVDPEARVEDYYETETYDSINRPTSSWGNYLIKKNK